MRKNKVVALIIIAGGVFPFLTTINSAIYDSSQREMPVSETTLPGISFLYASTSPPVRIIIPTIDVDAEVEEVGITWKGNMGTPKKFTNTGWYKYGTVPGEIGSAVIDGHVDNGFGLPGVFNHLKDLKPGDDVYVETGTAQKIHFVVSRVEKYYYKDVPLEVVFNAKDGTYLNLITCDGEWVPAEQTNDHRIVVYATLSA
jgi:sortase A